MTTDTNTSPFDEANLLAARAAMRLRSVLDAARCAALHGDELEPVPFDGDTMRNILDVAVDELDRLTDAADAMDQAYRAATEAGGAA
ncbi:MAG: hypothetical protein AB7P31_15150 [Steroidobacteraceae bacterium]